MTGDERGVRLAAAFALGRYEGMEQVARGAMGAVWRLTSTDAVYAAKEPFWTPPLEADVLKEVAFRNAAADAGVRSPEPLVTPTGEYVAEGWRLFEWIDGVVPDRSDASASVWLATQMGRIHSLAWEAGQEVKPNPFYHRVAVDWPAVAAKASADDVGWARQLADLVPRLDELTAVVNEAPIDQAVWCHRDLKITNVLRAAGNNWLVDWDNVGPMTPWRELGALLLGYLRDASNYNRIATAYRDAGGTAKVDGPAAYATGLAIWLNFLNGQVGAALDPDLSPVHRRYAEEKVAGLFRAIDGLPAWSQVAGRW